MTRYEIIFIIKCIQKYHLSSTHLADPLGDIIRSITFDKEDVLLALNELSNSTDDGKLHQQLKAAIAVWKDVPTDAPEIEEEEFIKPEDYPI